jgi:hypothetical protein
MKSKAIMQLALSGWLIVGASAILFADEKSKNEMIEYEVLAVDPQSWIVRAKEVDTEKEVKFRLPPEVFEGQTFDADFARNRIGQRFSVRGSKNTKLNDLIMEIPISEGENASKQFAAKSEMAPPAGAALSWLIEKVDGKRWIVKSRNRVTNQIVKLRVHPESFVGFHFKASLRNIRKGQGFTIFAPNDMPMNNCCTLLKFLTEENK